MPLCTIQKRSFRIANRCVFSRSFGRCFRRKSFNRRRPIGASLPFGVLKRVSKVARHGGPRVAHQLARKMRRWTNFSVGQRGKSLNTNKQPWYYGSKVPFPGKKDWNFWAKRRLPRGPWTPKKKDLRPQIRARGQPLSG